MYEVKFVLKQRLHSLHLLTALNFKHKLKVQRPYRVTVLCLCLYSHCAIVVYIKSTA
jgi:hypothetical protein